MHAGIPSDHGGFDVKQGWLAQLRATGHEVVDCGAHSLVPDDDYEGLGFLGIELNEPRNRENAPVISAQNGRVAVRIIRTDEELMIARSVCRVLRLGAVNKSVEV